MQTRLDVGYSAYPHAGLHSCVHGLGGEISKENTRRQKVRMRSEVEETTGSIGGAGLPHMKTVGKSQSGSGAGARAKVSFHR